MGKCNTRWLLHVGAEPSLQSWNEIQNLLGQVIRHLNGTGLYGVCTVFSSRLCVRSLSHEWNWELFANYVFFSLLLWSSNDQRWCCYFFLSFSFSLTFIGQSEVLFKFFSYDRPIQWWMFSPSLSLSLHFSSSPFSCCSSSFLIHWAAEVLFFPLIRWPVIDQRCCCYLVPSFLSHFPPLSLTNQRCCCRSCSLLSFSPSSFIPHSLISVVVVDLVPSCLSLFPPLYLIYWLALLLLVLSRLVFLSFPLCLSFTDQRCCCRSCPVLSFSFPLYLSFTDQRCCCRCCPFLSFSLSPFIPHSLGRLRFLCCCSFPHTWSFNKSIVTVLILLLILSFQVFLFFSPFTWESQFFFFPISWDQRWSAMALLLLCHTIPPPHTHTHLPFSLPKSPLLFLLFFFLSLSYSCRSVSRVAAVAVTE